MLGVRSHRFRGALPFRVANGSRWRSNLGDLRGIGLRPDVAGLGRVLCPFSDCANWAMTRWTTITLEHGRARIREG